MDSVCVFYQSTIKCNFMVYLCIHSIASFSFESMGNISSCFFFFYSLAKMYSTLFIHLISIHDDQKHTPTLSSFNYSLYLFFSFIPHSFSRAHTPCAKKCKVLNEIPEVKPYQNLLKVKTCGIFPISYETLCKANIERERATFLFFFLFSGFVNQCFHKECRENKTQREAYKREDRERWNRFKD